MPPAAAVSRCPTDDRRSLPAGPPHRGASRMTTRAPLVPLVPLVSLLLAPLAAAQDEPGDVLAVQEISATAGGFDGPLGAGDEIGAAAAALGDLDGDGVPDLALGAPFDDGPPGIPESDLGAVWLAFLAPDGTVSGQLALDVTTPALAGVLATGDLFGAALARLDDLDGNGVGELAIGTPGAGAGRGAVLVLLVQAGGGVADVLTIEAEIDAGAEAFGDALAALHDVDGNGVCDLAIGAPGADAVDVVFLGALDGGEGDGLVLGRTRIDARTEGLPAPIPAGTEFGSAVARLTDQDGDGRDELVVGLPGDGPGRVFWLSLDTRGAIDASAVLEGEALVLEDGDAFGAALHDAGDLDGDGRSELMAGAPRSDGATGRVWTLFLDEAQVVADARPIDAATPALAGVLEPGDRFGAAVTALGDLDGDERPDAFVGAPGLDRALADTGGGLVLFLEAEMPSDGEPFTPLVGSLEGRAGRPSLTLPPPEGDDAIDEPVVIVPRASGNTVNATAASGSDGGLEFASAGDFETGAGPSMAATASFLSDNDLEDVLTANKEDDSVSFLMAQDLPDEPPFAEQVEIPLPFDGAPVAVASGRFGATGGLGFVVAGDVGVTVFGGDDRGGFTPLDFQPVPTLTDVVVGDLDGDGFDDLVTASGALAQGPGAEFGFAQVFFGDVIGSIAPGGLFADGQAIASVLLVDPDDDGDLDVLTVKHLLDAGPLGEPQSLIDLYENDGAGGFTLSPSTPAFATPSADGIHPTHGDVADVDGDGLDDVVYASSDSIALPPETFEDVFAPIQLTVLLADGEGGFEVGEVGTPYSGKGVAPLLEDLAPDPLDGDVDVVLVWYEDVNAGQEGPVEELQTFVALLAGDGEGGFFSPAPNQFVTGEQPGSPAVAQLDPGPGDQGLDVAVPNLGSNSLSLLLGDGEGGVLETLAVDAVDEIDPKTLPPFFVGGPRSIEVADLDGNGSDDLVVYNEWEDTSPLLPSPQVFASLSLYVTLGGGALQKTQYLPLPAGGGVALGDVDGDGVTDVVVGQSAGLPVPDALLVHPGLGDGTLGPPAGFALPAGLRATGGVALGDTDGDGDLDAVTTAVDLSGEGSGHVVVWRNDAGALSPQPQLVGSSWDDVRSLDLGDLDGDGVLDAAVGRRDGDLVVARGAGDGTLAPLTISPDARAVGGGALRVADVNGDGAPDVVSSNANAGSQAEQDFVRVLENDGGGDFDVDVLGGLSSSGVLGALRPAIADLDGDGALDTILSHGNAGALSILLNGLNTFEAYGDGKPGAGELVPVLGGQGVTALGAPVKLFVEDAVGGAPAILQVGTGRDEDGVLAVETLAFSVPFVLDGVPGQPRAGTWTFEKGLREVVEFTGFEITLQVLVFDEEATTSTPLFLAASNGLALTVQP